MPGSTGQLTEHTPGLAMAKLEASKILEKESREKLRYRRKTPKKAKRSVFYPKHQ